jgi:hypothetical protein
VHRRRAAALTPNEQGVIDAQIAATERQFQSFILPGVQLPEAARQAG